MAHGPFRPAQTLGTPATPHTPRAPGALPALSTPHPISDDGCWAEAVVRFNLDPAAYAHASWLPSWASQPAPRVRRELSHALLREHQLETCHDWTLRPAAARFFMMSPQALAAIGLAVGIASHRDSLRCVVLKDRLQSLREALGTGWSSLWLAASQTVPTRAQPLVLNWDRLDAAALRAHLIDIGTAQMLRLLDPGDPEQRAAAMRAAFCLPRGNASGAAPPLPGPEATRIAEAIVADFVPLLAPTWTWLYS